MENRRQSLRCMMVGLLAATASMSVLADPLIVTRMNVPGGTANTAVIAPGGAVTFEVRIDAPTVAPIGVSYRLLQTGPFISGYFSITDRSQVGSPFNDPIGGTADAAVTSNPGNLLGPGNNVNLGNNSPGLVGVAPANNILVTKVTLTSSPATPPGTYRIQPAAAVSFATEITTDILGNDVSMGDAFFDIVVTTATVPDAPAIGTATAGNGTATVSFTAPANDGGSAITGYAVTSHPAGGTDSDAGTTASSHAITGLANRTAYTFTVKATNAVGASASSAESNSVTPLAIPPAIANAFATSPIVIGQTSLLTITITNPNPATTLTGVAFADTLPAGITTPNVATTGCGGTVTTSANVISLAGGTVAAGGNCAIPVIVTGAQAQAAPWIDSISSVTSTEGGSNPTPATAAITVNKAATTAAIGSDVPHPSVVNTPVVVSATLAIVSPGAGAPAGSISVSDGATGCAIVLPASSCTWTPATVGARMLVATYGGDARFAGSVSPGVVHQVVAANQLGTVTVTKAGSGAGLVTSGDNGIVCGTTCANTYANGTTLALGATPNAGSVFTGWLGGCSGTGACVLNISGAVSVSATFAPGTVLPRIDIDGNNSYDPPTDGLLMIRYLFGQTGTALTSGAIGAGPARTTPTEIGQYLENIQPLLDVDGNGQADALTDGLMLIRYLFGLRGPALTTGAIGTGATRTAAEIETYIQSVIP